MLPAGRAGRILAISLTVMVGLIVFCGAVLPLHDWYEARSERLVERGRLAARMAELADQLPELRRRAAALPESQAQPGGELAGTTDAIAGASLLGLVQALAGQEGVTPASMENLPPEAAGAYRRIGLRVSLVASYPVLVRLLQTLQQSTPPLLVDDLEVEGARLINQPVDRPLDVRFSVFGFRREG